jgi:hypothetical protein
VRFPDAKNNSSDPPALCGRCGKDLVSGAVSYVVRIEAFADPAPPDVTAEDLEQDLRGEIERLIRDLEGLSEREAMDQVHRRMVLHLCAPCYQVWIEDPAGSAGD